MLSLRRNSILINQKSASKRDDSSKKVAKIQDTIEKSKKSTKIKTSRDCPTKVRSPDGAEESGPLVYEFQKQENGELKVVTTRDVSDVTFGVLKLGEIKGFPRDCMISVFL